MDFVQNYIDRKNMGVSFEKKTERSYSDQNDVAMLDIYTKLQN
jgi:hypothetical protein